MVVDPPAQGFLLLGLYGRVLAWVVGRAQDLPEFVQHFRVADEGSGRQCRHKHLDPWNEDGVRSQTGKECLQKQTRRNSPDSNMSDLGLSRNTTKRCLRVSEQSEPGWWSQVS